MPKQIAIDSYTWSDDTTTPIYSRKIEITAHLDGTVSLRMAARELRGVMLDAMTVNAEQSIRFSEGREAVSVSEAERRVLADMAEAEAVTLGRIADAILETIE